MKVSMLYLAILFSSIFFTQPLLAKEDPKNMKEVMQRISNDMGKLVGHLMKDEFDEVMKYAEKIANHDEPPVSHRMRIIANLGTEFPNFKKHDDDVHISALEMKKAAKNKDIDGVTTYYGKVMTSCNNCHKAYRKQIQAMNL